MSRSGRGERDDVPFPALTPPTAGGGLPESIQCIEFFLAALHVATSRGGLASFARLSLEPLRADDGPMKSRSDTWPCPPPRWGCWTRLSSLSPRRRKRHRFLRAKAFALQTLVIGLNWLSLGHAARPPAHARVGAPMNQHQLVMLEHLEELVTYFMSAGERPLSGVTSLQVKLE